MTLVSIQVLSIPKLITDIHCVKFKATMRNFQFLLILAPPLDKSGSDTSTFCHKDLC